MKRYILLSALLPLTFLLSCSREPFPMDVEEKALQERIDASTDIEVNYLVDGVQTRSIDCDSRALHLEVEVDINDPALVWMVESNRKWCEVLPGNHKGPGSFTVSVKANDSFESREPATLTFVAGAFRGFEVTVSQDGSAFLLSQPYFVMSKGGGEVTVNVTVQKKGGAEPDWTIASDSWISASKGSVVRQDEGSVTRQVNVSCQSNGSATRLGTISLTLPGQSSGSGICVSQFGTDYNYDGDGNIFFSKEEQARISFTAPDKTISRISVPEYAAYAIDDNGDGTVQVTVTASDNLSDCSETRLSQTTLILSDATASEVALPTFCQDYLPAHGLLSAKGLVRFSQAVAAGESTADWEKDGVINLLGDIDMTGISSWTGIGTAERPFSGIFDGNDCTVDNLTGTSVGLFNVCRDAIIKRTRLGKGCNIWCNSSSSSETALGGIVSQCTASEITSCTFSGELEYAAPGVAGSSACVGAIAGRTDAASGISLSTFDGKITFSTTQSGEMRSDVGGIAGCNPGQTISCESKGDITLVTNVSHLFAAGILPVLNADASAYSNAFSGKILLSGTSVENVIGGLYGSVAGNHTFDFTTDKSIILGDFTFEKFGGSAAASLFAGGFAGRIEGQSNVRIAGFECGSNFTIDHSLTAINASWICAGGAVGGCNPASDAKNSPGSLTLKSLTYIGTITVPSVTTVASAVTVECLSGIMGYLNGPAEISGCVNKGNLGDNADKGSTSRSNGKCQIVAGILALAENGNLKISGCSNSGTVLSAHYNNNAYDGVVSGRYSCNVQSGILGGFGYSNTHSDYTLTLTDCSCSGCIQGYRGISAGIAGYAENATISGCEVSARFSGTTMDGKSAMGNNSAYKGSVAGVLYKSKIDNCTARSDIFATSAGSEASNPGGILSVDAGGGTSVGNCSYYGNIVVGVKADGKECYTGGIVALGSESLTVSDCRFGGTLEGSIVNVNNLDSFAVGSGRGTRSGITLWDGK